LITGHGLKIKIAGQFGGIQAMAVDDASAGPARYFHTANADSVFGVITAISDHFCDSCNRVRVTSTGELHTCLGYDDATDLRSILRSPGTREQQHAEIVGAVMHALSLKRAGHVFLQGGVGGPAKHMISMGG